MLHGLQGHGATTKHLMLHGPEDMVLAQGTLDVNIWEDTVPPPAMFMLHRPGGNGAMTGHSC